MKRLFLIFFLVRPFLMQGSLQTELQELHRRLNALESALIKSGKPIQSTSISDADQKVIYALNEIEEGIKRFGMDAAGFGHHLHKQKDVSSFDKKIIESLYEEYSDLLGTLNAFKGKLNAIVQDLQKKKVQVSEDTQKKAFAIFEKAKTSLQDAKDRLNKVVQMSGLQHHQDYNKNSMVHSLQGQGMRTINIKQMVETLSEFFMKDYPEQFRLELGRRLGLEKEESSDEIVLKNKLEKAKEALETFKEASDNFLNDLNILKNKDIKPKDFDSILLPNIGITKFTVFVNTSLMERFPDLYKKEILPFLYAISNNFDVLHRKISDFKSNNRSDAWRDEKYRLSPYNAKMGTIYEFIDGLLSQLQENKESFYNLIIEPIKLGLGGEEKTQFKW